MEKFYKAEPDSRLHRDYMAWLRCREKAIDIAKELLKEYGVKAGRYSIGRYHFAIEATPGDLDRFRKQLCKNPDSNGLYAFRRNSCIGRDWEQQTKDLTVLSTPFVPWYFKNALGQMKTRLFAIGGTVYCSLECTSGAIPGDKLTEIKASEFFRIIEEAEGD